MIKVISIGCLLLLSPIQASFFNNSNNFKNNRIENQAFKWAQTNLLNIEKINLENDLPKVPKAIITPFEILKQEIKPIIEIQYLPNEHDLLPQHIFEELKPNIFHQKKQIKINLNQMWNKAQSRLKRQPANQIKSKQSTGKKQQSQKNQKFNILKTKIESSYEESVFSTE